MRWLSAIALALGALSADAAPADEPWSDAADIEFLEYLGTLVFGGDEWVGPDDMAGPGEPTLPIELEDVQGLDEPGAGDSSRRTYLDDFERDLQEGAP